jgi:hypothetical protein
VALGDLDSGSRVVPAIDADDRRVFLRWLIYMATSPYMTFVQLNHPDRFLDDPATHAALIDNARRRLELQFSALVCSLLWKLQRRT